MKNLNSYVYIYKEKLKKDDIQEAYVGHVKYVTRLGPNYRKTFQNTSATKQACTPKKTTTR